MIDRNAHMIVFGLKVLGLAMIVVGYLGLGWFGWQAAFVHDHVLYENTPWIIACLALIGLGFLLLRYFRTPIPGAQRHRVRA